MVAILLKSKKLRNLHWNNMELEETRLQYSPMLVFGVYVMTATLAHCPCFWVLDVGKGWLSPFPSFSRSPSLSQLPLSDSLFCSLIFALWMGGGDKKQRLCIYTYIYYSSANTDQTEKRKHNGYWRCAREAWDSLSLREQWRPKVIRWHCRDFA